MRRNEDLEARDFAALLIGFSVALSGSFAVGFARDHVNRTLLPDHVPDPPREQPEHRRGSFLSVLAEWRRGSSYHPA